MTKKIDPIVFFEKKWTNKKKDKQSPTLIKGTGPSVFLLFSAKRLKKKLGHFLVQKDGKKSWVIFSEKRLKKK